MYAVGGISTDIMHRELFVSLAWLSGKSRLSPRVRIYVQLKACQGGTIPPNSPYLARLAAYAVPELLHVCCFFFASHKQGRFAKSVIQQARVDFACFASAIARQFLQSARECSPGLSDCMFASRNAATQLTRLLRLFPRSHLITSYTESVAKSAKGCKSGFRCSIRPLSHTTMSSLDNITQSLAALSIQPAATVSHDATGSPAAWREALEASASAPKSFEIIKTLVYKPKTAKTATPVPLVIVARESTEVISGAIGKKLSLKDLRLASEDLLTEFFSLDKNSRTLRLHVFDFVV